MDDTTIVATWDDTGNVGFVNLTKAELEDFTTSTASDKGEHMTSMLKNTFFIGFYLFSEVRREILMETDNLIFKLRLKFDICCMASKDRKLPQIEEDPSLLYDTSMCHISV